MVSPAYLRAMGVPLVRGRWPTHEDALDVVVVNETFAKRRARPRSDRPDDRRILPDRHDRRHRLRLRAREPRRGPMPELYYPYQRSPFMPGVPVAVRMSAAVVPDVRRRSKARSHAAGLSVPEPRAVAGGFDRASALQHVPAAGLRSGRRDHGAGRRLRGGRPRGATPHARDRRPHRHRRAACRGRGADRPPGDGLRAARHRRRRRATLAPAE